MEDQGQKDQKEEKGKQDASFFERIIALILRSEDPEREKRRLLKQIAKDLKKQRYKFYKPKGFEAQPSLAKFRGSENYHHRTLLIRGTDRAEGLSFRGQYPKPSRNRGYETPYPGAQRKAHQLFLRVQLRKGEADRFHVQYAHRLPPLHRLRLLLSP
jgi:hypothetical protein